MRAHGSITLLSGAGAIKPRPEQRLRPPRTLRS